MPQVIKVGAYTIYFWLDEGRPLEHTYPVYPFLHPIIIP